MADPVVADPDQIPLGHEAWQFAALQNPVLDPGFSLLASGVPLWEVGSGSVVDGALSFTGEVRQSHGQVVGVEAGVPIVVSPYVGFETLALEVLSGFVDIELAFAEKSTGKTVTVSWSDVPEGTHVLDLTTATVVNPVPAPDDEVLAQSLWIGIEFSSVNGALIDDVALDGVSYGDPLLSLEWDEPTPSGAPPVPDGPVKPFHDGFGVLIDVVEVPAAGGAAPSHTATVSFVRFTPSGALPYDPTSDLGITLRAIPFDGSDETTLGTWSPADGTSDVEHGGILFPAASFGPFDIATGPNGVQAVRIEASLELDPTSISDPDAYPEGHVVGAFNAAKLSRPDAPVVDGLDLVPQPLIVRTLEPVVTGDTDEDGVDDFVEKRVCDRRYVRSAVNESAALGRCESWHDWSAPL